jgi:AraC-like DNA-binding protein
MRENPMSASDVSMAKAAQGLDMLRLYEVPHRGHPGVLGFLMARAEGPPTVVRRPSLDCYLLGIGLNIATIRIDANGRTLRRGTYGMHGVHLVQPNQDADYGFSGRLVNFRLRLSTDAVAAALEEMGLASAGVELADMAEQSDKVLGSLCRRLLRENLSAHPDTLLIDSAMQMLVDRIVTLNATRPVRPAWQESLSASQRQRAIDYIRHSYMREISLPELSTAVGLSRSHFLRAFRNTLGTPPHAFVTMYRLHKAGELLRRMSLTLTQIAAGTGFSSHAHMAATFRQWLGFTPSELRAPARHGFSDAVALLLP